MDTSCRRPIEQAKSLSVVYLTTDPLSSTRRVHLPRDVVLTPTVLVAAAHKLPTPELEQMIDALIAETDLRAGDIDLEPDSDHEPDDAA